MLTEFQNSFTADTLVYVQQNCY